MSTSRRPLRILAATIYEYYGQPNTIEPQYYYLCRVPAEMGHEVEHFDFRRIATDEGNEAMRRQFLDRLRAGRYDAAFVTTFEDEFDHETLQEAKGLTNTFAWNSDDEWRWDSYSSKYVDDYTFMVTNAPSVHEANKERHPNLLLYQWACTGFWNGMDTPKDIDFSFAGQVYGKRQRQIAYLSLRSGMQAWGFRSGRRWSSGQSVRRHNGPLARAAGAVRVYRPLLGKDVLRFEAINEIWNRTKVSFTPLDSSTGDTRQIKSRVFDMGLSGTLMLAHRAPHLDSYYEPEREYVPFETIAEAAEKARFYAKNEQARRKIALAYAERTRKEHMWSHRIDDVLTQAGL
jgi:hypothetical protein